MLAGTFAWFWEFGNILIIDGHAYILASWTLSKPVIYTYIVRLLWTSGLFLADWSSGRLYAINCIGEGFMGMYNHFWNMFSASCTTLLLSHFIYMGVFVASFLCTNLIFAFWAYKNIKEHEYTKEISGLIYNHGDILPNGWEINKDPQGKTYYVNHISSTTQWEPPSSSNESSPPPYKRPSPQQPSPQQTYNGSYNSYNSNGY